jgi:phage-related minor tail protein
MNPNTVDLLGAKMDAAALRTELESLNRLGEDFGRTMSRAFVSAAVDGRKLSDVLRTLMQSLSRQALTAALQPLQQMIGGALGAILPNARGNVVASSRITPFATGGVVNGATLFPMSAGLGLMGEAGPEAIMPLARGRDGKLGIRASDQRPLSITMNISTPDAESFRRSGSQVSASLLRLIERGTRNL